LFYEYVKQILKIHPADNVLVALTDLKAGEQIVYNGSSITLAQDVQAKHKFAIKSMHPEADIIMYGLLVGKALHAIPEGGVIATNNVKHKSSEFSGKTKEFKWTSPDVSRWKDKTFMGYHRGDDQVGTANYWIVIPLVFCENRNINIMRNAFEEALGFAKHDIYKTYVHELVELYQEGKTDAIKSLPLVSEKDKGRSRLFKNIDGIKFLTHEGGCGGTRQDSEALCALLAGYINNRMSLAPRCLVLVAKMRR
jgi:altronate hydrolase